MGKLIILTQKSTNWYRWDFAKKKFLFKKDMIGPLYDGIPRLLSLIEQIFFFSPLIHFQLNILSFSH